jgi:hypothetical protein
MYPIVEQYITAVDTATLEHRIKLQDLRAKRYTAREGVPLDRWASVDTSYWDSIRLVNDARDQAYREAWELLKTSDDPLVLFIAENCYEYQDHARSILELLPADFAAMQQVARTEGWCGVFDRFAAAAVRKKLITDERTPALRRLEMHIVKEFGAYALPSLLPLIEAHVRSEVRRDKAAQRKAIAKPARTASAAARTKTAQTA